MRRTVLIVAALVAALAVVPVAPAATSQSGQVPVHVSPGAGGRHTRFTFTMVLPLATGVSGSWTRFDYVEVSGPRRARCVSSGSAVFPAGSANTTARTTLNPSRLGGSWCTGTFHGEVIESQRTSCGPPMLIICPQIEIAPQVIGRFTFRVR
jgi:hypothetical protein